MLLFIICISLFPGFFFSLPYSLCVSVLVRVYFFVLILKRPKKKTICIGRVLMFASFRIIFSY